MVVGGWVKTFMRALAWTGLGGINVLCRFFMITVHTCIHLQTTTFTEIKNLDVWIFA